MFTAMKHEHDRNKGFLCSWKIATEKRVHGDEVESNTIILSNNIIRFLAENYLFTI